MRRLLLLILVMLLAAMSNAQEDDPFDQFLARLDEIRAADGDEAQAMVRDLWLELTATENIPFVVGERVAFLWRGDARTVDWRGDFTGWEFSPGAAGERVGDTDLWVALMEFPSDARLDYKIVVNNATWLLDDVNPYQQVGGFGPNSELRMPDYVYPVDSIVREDVPHGTLSTNYNFRSNVLDYVLHYRVYTPAGYRDMEDPLPVIFVTDGQEYADDAMGGMVNVLDNLIADGRIRPVIVVFVDARDPQTEANRRTEEFIENRDYAAFLAEELAPEVDRFFNTDPENRMILGTSLGGLNALYTSVIYPHVFPLVGIQSPAFWVSNDIESLYQDAAELPLTFYITNGLPEWDADDLQPVLDYFEAQGVTYEYLEVAQGHSWGNWRSTIDDMLIYFFGEI